MSIINNPGRLHCIAVDVFLFVADFQISVTSVFFKLSFCLAFFSFQITKLIVIPWLIWSQLNDNFLEGGK